METLTKRIHDLDTTKVFTFSELLTPTFLILTVLIIVLIMLYRASFLTIEVFSGILMLISSTLFILFETFRQWYKKPYLLKVEALRREVTSFEESLPPKLDVGSIVEGIEVPPYLSN